MFSLGAGDLTLVLVAVVLVFSSGRLGSFGDALGRLMTGRRGAKSAAPLDAPAKGDGAKPPRAGA